MKTALLLTAALLAGPAMTTAGTVQGCETVAVTGSNYTVKADPTCVFAGEFQGNARGLVPVSFDVDGKTVPGIGMSDVPGAGIPLGG
jgi:hypothetical protein